MKIIKTVWKQLNVRIKCDALRDLGSVTIWRLYGHSNACQCMLMLYSIFISFFIRLRELARHSNGSITVKHFNAIETGMLPDFILSWELQCNVIFHCTTSCTLEHLYLQCNSMFSLVCCFLFIVYYLVLRFLLFFTIFF